MHPVRRCAPHEMSVVNLPREEQHKDRSFLDVLRTPSSDTSGTASESQSLRSFDTHCLRSLRSLIQCSGVRVISNARKAALFASMTKAKKKKEKRPYVEGRYGCVGWMREGAGVSFYVANERDHRRLGDLTDLDFPELNEEQMRTIAIRISDAFLFGTNVGARDAKRKIRNAVGIEE